MSSSPELIRDLDPAELAWGRTQQDKLNHMINQTVSFYKFAKYAPIDFDGHELCTSLPWVQDFKSKAPFHPNADGQAVFAKAVVTYDSSF